MFDVGETRRVTFVTLGSTSTGGVIVTGGVIEAGGAGRADLGTQPTRRGADPAQG